MRSRPPRDAAWRGGWDPELHRSVLGIEDAPLPAGEAPGVGGGRRSFRGAPAGSLDAGFTRGTRTHAGTRTAQSPAGPGGQPHSLTLRDGLRLLLGASGHHPSLRCLLLQLPLRRLPKPGPTQSPAFPLPQGARLPRMRRPDSGSVHFPTTGKLPSGASGFRVVQRRKAEVCGLADTGARKVSV